MSFTTISPNMSLTIPVTGQETGPNWANDLNNSLLVIDGHTHAAGSGVPITPDGLNINADLPIQLHNITGARSVRFNNYPSLGPFAPTAADVGALFEIASELYYADGIGNLVQMTKLGFVNSGAGSISGLAGFPNASASYIGASGTFVWQQGVNVAANMDSATLILRYPGSYPTPTGNYIAIQAPSSLATGYAFTLPAAPPLASNSLLTSNTVGDLSYTSFDQVGQGMTATGANAIANSRTRATGTAVVGLGGVAITNSCGEFHTTSTTEVDVTNLFATIATSGRPISVKLIGDVGNSNFSATNNSASFNAPGLAILILRRISPAGPWINILTTNVGAGNFVSGSSAISFLPTLEFIDVIGSGTFDYKVQLKRGSLSFDASLINVKLVVYEL